MQKNGHRLDGRQRYECNKCGRGFTEKTQKSSEYDGTIRSRGLNRAEPTLKLAGEREKHPETGVGAVVGTEMGEMKTLQIQSSDLLKTFPEDIQPKILQYAVKELSKGRAELGVKTYIKDLRQLLKRGADLYDPQSVAETIANVPKEEWEAGTKENKVISYNSFLKFLGGNWEKPHYKKRRKVPFIPLEKEIDELVAGCSKLVATSLQVAKDTGARKGEIGRLEWIDIDFERCVIAINHPEKGSDTRVVPVTRKCVEMINQLPKRQERIFRDMASIYKRLMKQRRRLAYKLDNPRLLKIGLHTMRHWKGTMEYHRKPDLLHVAYILGHRNIRNTQIYVHLEHQLFQNGPADDFIVKVAHNVQEACKLLEVGFEYVGKIHGDEIFKKRK